MPKHKKKRAHQTSKGERRSMQKLDVGRSQLDRELDALSALRKNKRVWETIPNPNPNETAKRFIRVRRENPFRVPEKRKPAGRQR